MRVSPTAIASLAQHDLLSVVNHLGDDLFCRLVDDHRAKRKTQHRGFSFAAVTILAQSMLTSLAFPVRLELEIDEVVGVVIPPQDDVPSLAAVASVRPTPGFVLLPAEGDAASPSVTGLNLDHTFVDKHGDGKQLQGNLDPLAQVGRNIEILTFEEIAVGLVEMPAALHLRE